MESHHWVEHDGARVAHRAVLGRHLRRLRIGSRGCGLSGGAVAVVDERGLILVGVRRLIAIVHLQNGSQVQDRLLTPLLWFGTWCGVESRMPVELIDAEHGREHLHLHPAHRKVRELDAAHHAAHGHKLKEFAQVVEELQGQNRVHRTVVAQARSRCRTLAEQ